MRAPTEKQIKGAAQHTERAADTKERRTRAESMEAAEIEEENGGEPNGDDLMKGDGAGHGTERKSGREDKRK